MFKALSYAEGRPFVPALGKGYNPETAARKPGRISPSSAAGPAEDSFGAWSAWWDKLVPELRLRGYADASIRYFRMILRKFQPFAGGAPDDITRAEFERYLGKIAENRPSWNWIAMNICVIRTLFDKIGGKTVAGDRPMPRRGKRLPRILDPDDVEKLFNAAETLRDRLLLGLAYGCGLKPGEVRRVRWGDIDPDRKSIRVHAGPTAPDREILLPDALLPVLTEGKARFAPGDWVFPGLRADKPLSLRAVGAVVQTLARQAGVGPVCPMILRHAYAIECLQAGMNIRELQEALGHKNVETTMKYQNLLLAQGVASPLDHLRGHSGETRPAHSSEASPVEIPLERDLFDADLSFETLLDPGHPAKSFLSLLKTRLKSTFTSLRRPAARPSP